METIHKLSSQTEEGQNQSRNTQRSYRIKYHPQLIEETVLRAISGHHKESLFRIERDRLYEWQDDETREEAFQELHHRWFECLGLGKPLHEVLEFWPILKESTYKCLLMKAHSTKDACAELYLAPKESGLSERERRTIVIQVTSELLGHSQQLLTFLRHEILHIVDMLDPKFGYKPNFPKTNIGPTYERFFQERYRILWDITIDGRLHHKGWLPQSVREKHLAIFKDIFAGPHKELEKLFTYFFDKEPHTHRELVSFIQSPEKWFDRFYPELSFKGQCSLCHFPTFHLIDSSANLYPSLINKIQEEHPDWHPKNPICRQCADLYESRLC